MMPAAKVFTDLLIWQRSRAWSKQIFQKTRLEPFCRDRRLVEQINDSSESVMANIAEGFGRGTQAEFITFLGYCLGSLNETQSHLCTAYDRDYLFRQDFGPMFQEGTSIRKMIIGFIRSMVLPRSGVRNLHKYKSWAEEVWERYEKLTGKRRPQFMVSKPESSQGNPSA
jgi:four helix bundle protein